MSEREPRVVIIDILNCIRKMLVFTEGKTFDEFIANEMAVDAVYRNIEVMGEATNRLPQFFMNEYPEIPWHKMIATRNIIIHQYEEVDNRIVWNIVTTILPDLKIKLEKLLETP